MEPFRQIGEVVGSLKALMVFRDNIRINQRQCCLLVDILSFAYDSISEEMRQNLKFEEKNVKWKVLEQPLKELYRVFKEGEAYVKHCMETKDWWAKVIILYKNTDCIELHIHNLLSLVPVVIEAIENAGEISGWDLVEAHRKRVINARKYSKEYKDMNLFQWKFGKQYLVTENFCNRFDTVSKEDRWILLDRIAEKKISVSTKEKKKLTELLFKMLDGSESLKEMLLPSSVLLGSKDYQVRRRLGVASQYKEISWLGESFALRHFTGDMETLLPEVTSLLALSHPNVLHSLCGFTDEEKKECYLLMELMLKDLSSHVKETCRVKKRIPFSLPAAVDLMLQIARGMEYLHHKKIYHGELNPMNIFVKTRPSSEGYVYAKVSGFGLSSAVPVNVSHKGSSNQNQNESFPFIWYAPEVLEEQEQTGSTNCKYTEKADVYSFAMVCFELLTSKVPFDDGHLQGDLMSRNIRAGERPLFPSNVQKYLANLTRRCWNSDPNQRPSFSSICRILRYTKRFLAMNPDYTNGQMDLPLPPPDYFDIESGLLKMFPSWDSSDLSSVSIIPFQMFAYRVVEKEKVSLNYKDTSESGSGAASPIGDDPVTLSEDDTHTSADDLFPSPLERSSSISVESINKKVSMLKKAPDVITSKQRGTARGKSVRPPKLSHSGRSLRTKSEKQTADSIPKMKRSSSEHGLASGHVSDSELSKTSSPHHSLKAALGFTQTTAENMMKRKLKAPWSRWT